MSKKAVITLIIVLLVVVGGGWFFWASRFDPGRWRAYHQGTRWVFLRRYMLDDLTHNYLRPGMPKDQVIVLLGPSDSSWDAPTDRFRHPDASIGYNLGTGGECFPDVCFLIIYYNTHGLVTEFQEQIN